MSYITLGFAHDPDDWISEVMSFVTFGDWTHVALIHDGVCIEASSLGEPSGVRTRSLDSFMLKPNATLRRMAHPDPEGVWNAAASQLGKKYDWSWVWGYFLRRRTWNSPDRWVCSELVAWACARAGKALVHEEELWRVTPQLLWMISEAA